MSIKDYLRRLATRTRMGTRLSEDAHYRVIVRAVCSLVFHLLFAFYYAILGFLSSSLIFITSAAYYLLLSVIRFSAVLLDRREQKHNHEVKASAVGVMLIVLGVSLHIMIIVSMKQKTAAVYDTVPMIAIATFTFTKITAAIVTAVKHRRERSKLYQAIRAIRYSEVAVSLLTMQQSMLVSFDGAGEQSRIILNACTGAGVCFLILALGVMTLKNSRKIEDTSREDTVDR